MSSAKRTDILFHSLRGHIPAKKHGGQGIKALNIRELKNKNIKFLCCPNVGNGKSRLAPKKKLLRKLGINYYITAKSNNIIKPINHNLKLCPEKRQFIYNHCKLLLGVRAMLWASKYKPKELFICGADFYKTIHHSNYRIYGDHFSHSTILAPKHIRKRVNKAHGLRKNKRLLINLITAKDNVFIDTITSNSLKGVKQKQDKYIEKQTIDTSSLTLR